MTGEMWFFKVVVAALTAAITASGTPDGELDRRQSGINMPTSPPSYPSPWGRGTGDWAEAYAKARAFVGQLTLLEKVNLTTGVGWESERCVGNVGAIPRLGLHALCMQDSPLGIRFADYVSAFPAGINVAATWDRNLAYARGLAMGEEHRGKGVDVQLGPVCGPLGRAPAGGRNWEGFSPDPYLTGALIAPTIQGIQKAGVVACTKHFIANEQEHFRQVPEANGYGYNITATLSSNIDDKTMHELYLWPFADAVRAGTGSIMCSYQQINNSYGCQNSYTMNHLLKNELDFQGFVMSDWQAHHSGVGAALAGMDMSMPGDVVFNSGTSYWGSNLTIAVLNGTVPQYRVDDMAIRIMAAYYYVGRDQVTERVSFSSWTRDTYGPLHASVGGQMGLVNEHVDVRGEHAALIRAVGQASTVLLKNNGGLPLSGKERWVGIFGDDAGSNSYGANGCPDHGCDNGTLAMGWGSGTADYPYLVTPEQAIQNYVLTQTRGQVFTVTDNNAQSQISTTARQADVALVFVNADSGEGYINVDGNEGDRNNLTLWRQGDQLIQNVTAQNNNTIVIIHSVGAVDVSQWYDNDNVTAVLWAGLPGQESGNAITDVLYGLVNPGGKLPFTIARNREDYGTDVLYEPNNGNLAPQDDFAEGVFIDYRYLDQNSIEPIYEFGFGLSYTTFVYSNLVVTPTSPPPYSPATGETGPAPTYGSIVNDTSSYLFPGDIERIREYIYPYINSTDLEASSGESDYGLPTSDYTPEGATDSSSQPILPAGGAPGGNPGLWDAVATVSATVRNTGSVDGDEVVQLYVALGEGEPPKVLRGFDRLHIPAGQSATFTATLTRRDVSVWDVVTQNWVQVSNPTIFVGASSRKLPLSAPLSGSYGHGGSGGSGSSGIPGSSGTSSRTSASQGYGTTQPTTAAGGGGYQTVGDGGSYPPESCPTGSYSTPQEPAVSYPATHPVGSYSTGGAGSYSTTSVASYSTTTTILVGQYPAASAPQPQWTRW